MNRRKSCLISVLLVAGIGGIALLLFFLEVLARPPDDTPAQAFFAARNRWVGQPFSRYRLVIEQEGDLQPRCRQESEIRNGRVVDVVENSCASGVQTIDDLFATIEKYTTSEVCGPNGCDCDGRIVAYASYHPQLGYPQSIALALQPRRRLWPISLFSQRSCTLIGFSSGPTITVVQVTPLP